MRSQIKIESQLRLQIDLMYDKIEDVNKDKKKLQNINEQGNNLIMENIKETQKIKKNIETYSKENKKIIDAKFDVEEKLLISKNENVVMANKIKLLTSQMDKLKDQIKKLQINAESAA